MPSQKPIRCALYDRVSTELQVRDGLSLDAQRQALTDYAHAHGYQIVDYYTDEGLTARKRMQNRKELLRLLEDVKKDKIDLILVTKLDRWFRNIKDYHNTQSILEAHHCNWKTIFEDYDTSTANGRFAINIMLSVNENECDRDSDRIKDVFAYKRRNGEILSGSHASFGYRAEGKKFVKDEETKSVVEDFFAHYFSCFSKRGTISYILEKYGDRAPSESTLLYMFKNPVYYGRAYDTDGFCEAYITREQFDLIRKTGSLKEHPGGNFPYLFSGLIKCPVCGRSFTGFQHRNKKKNGKVYVHPAYRCRRRAASGQLCPCSLTIFESTVERYVLAHAEEKVSGLSALRLSLLMRLPSSSEKSAVSESIHKLEEELRRLNLLFQKGRVEEAYYDTQYRLISGKLEKRKKEAETAPSSPPLPAKDLFEGSWKDAYTLLDTEHRRIFWHDKLRAIHLNPDARGIKDVELLSRW